MSLVARVYLLVLLAAAPGFVLELYRDFEDRAEGERRLEAEALRLAEFANLELSKILDGARAFLGAVAAHPSIRAGDAAACNDYLASLTPIPEPFLGPLIVDRDGSVICRIERGKPIGYVGDRQYFRDAVASRRLTIGNLVVTRGEGRLSLPIALPLLDDVGAVKAVASVGVSATHLQEWFRDRGWPPEGSISIIDRSGTIVVRWPNPERVGQKIPDEFRWMLSASEPGVTSGIGPDGVKRIGGFMPPGVSNDLLVTVAVSRAAALAELDAQLRRDLIVLGACALAAMAAALVYGRQLIAGPLAMLGAAVDRLRQGDLSARAGLPDGGSELGRLGAAFDGMAAELQRQQVELRRSEAFFRQFAEHLPEVVWVEDVPTGRIAYVNGAYERIWGTSREALLAGSANWLDHVHPADRAALEATLARARAGSIETIEYRVVRPDAELRWIHSTAFPIREPDGTVVRLARMSRDITRRREAEEAREEALRQRGMLFDELNHRVKNNLQIVRSLLRLQSTMIEEPTAREALETASQRVTAVAELHALLHSRGVGGEVDLGEYIAGLCEALGEALLDGTDRIVIETSLEPIEVGMDRAVPVGMITSELVTNSLKYAFPPPRRGRVSVALEAFEGGRVRLRIADDGGGKAEGGRFGREGFGMRIVRMLAQQLGGTLSLQGGAGVTVQLELDLDPKAPDRAAA